MADTRFRLAVPKGALFPGCVALLTRAGVDVGALADPGRQLIIDTDEMRFIIGKPTDIPAYVAYGAADAGISGADVLAEAALDVAELADLRFGACRFVVAEREGATEDVEQSYRRLGVIRVATKYPRIAEAHFAARGIQVELVKLHGNIELAPLIGLADRVVDITATGTTLRENGLRIVEGVMDSTARFIANPVAMRIDAQRVNELVKRLSTAAAQAEEEGVIV
jgi:ATP phosphoribosyltransferase regulatory subunit